MIIAHISDTHLGYRASALPPERMHDFEAAWLDACWQAVDGKPDLIVHSGDLFHQPRPSWSAVGAAIRGLRLLCAAAPTVLITGNHDVARMRTQHTVFTTIAQAVPELRIAAEYTPVGFGLPELSAFIWSVPHGALVANDWDVWPTTEDINVLVVHGDIESRGEKSTELGSVWIPEKLLERDWDYVALGHLHERQAYGERGWYAGSTERCGWSDINASPSFTLVSVEAKGKPFIVPLPVQHRPFYQLEARPALGDDYATATTILGDIRGYQRSEGIYRCQLEQCSATQLSRVTALVKRSANPLAFGVQLSRETIEEEKKELTLARVGLEKLSLPDLLAEYVASRFYDRAPYPEGFAERFTQRALEALADADAGLLSQPE